MCVPVCHSPHRPCLAPSCPVKRQWTSITRAIMLLFLFQYRIPSRSYDNRRWENESCVGCFDKNRNEHILLGWKWDLLTASACRPQVCLCPTPGPASLPQAPCLPLGHPGVGRTGGTHVKSMVPTGSRGPGLPGTFPPRACKKRGILLPRQGSSTCVSRPRLRFLPWGVGDKGAGDAETQLGKDCERLGSRKRGVSDIK